jgi:hypothetical protein
LVVIAYLIAFGERVMGLVVMPAPQANRLPLILLLHVAQIFLITPYIVAVHRFIILGEVTTDYRLTPGQPRFQRFFYWLLILLALRAMPSLLVLLGSSHTIFIVAFAVFYIVYIAVWLRMIILFPAIAVDAPGAPWRRAMDDTEGHAWTIFFTIVIAALPLLPVGIVGAAVLSGLPLEIFNAALDPIGYTLIIVIASRLYEQLGDRVRQSA